MSNIYRSGILKWIWNGGKIIFSNSGEQQSFEPLQDMADFTCLIDEDYIALLSVIHNFQSCKITSE